MIAGRSIASGRMRRYVFELMKVMAANSVVQSGSQSDQISFGDIFSGRDAFSGRKSP
jgi:hypothetical protein